ncbi:MAG: CCA tRNA nucleotidyltransferase [Candidatus Saganbacteria bacterium]|nr:CCA tRNA nucleotidyltransferase [Candidatus Saganbacteria bacterium]
MFKENQFPEGVIKIALTLKNNGFRCYVVGGGIRDLLMGLSPLEFDLTTDATPDKVTALFARVIPTGIDFGTVTVHLPDGDFEVTTFRSDERYTDGRRPDKVTYTKSIEEDLSRRDFTINAIAYDPLTKELIDKFGGRSDIKKKLIRTVGNPAERFNEDGLRPFRACRFAAKLEFDIEEKTFGAIPGALDRAKMVSPERIREEIMKMLLAKKPSIGIDLMRRSGLLKIMIPELEEGFGVEQPKAFHKWDVYYHSLYSCDAAPLGKPVVRLAALLHDIAKPRCKVEFTFYNHDTTGEKMAEEIMKRLRFSNADIDKVKNLVRNHMFNYTGEWSDAAVRRFMRRVGPENLDDLFTLRAADIKAMEKEIEVGDMTELKQRIAKVIEDENALDVKGLKVNGKDVMDILHIGPGPKVGEVLNNLLEKVLDDPKLNERENLLGLIKSYGKGS